MKNILFYFNRLQKNSKILYSKFCFLRDRENKFLRKFDFWQFSKLNSLENFDFFKFAKINSCEKSNFFHLRNYIPVKISFLKVCRIQFIGDIHFLSFRPQIPFQGKFGPKNQNCQFELKFGTYTNLNMPNSMVVITSSIFDRKYLF